MSWRRRKKELWVALIIILAVINLFNLHPDFRKGIIAFLDGGKNPFKKTYASSGTSDAWAGFNGGSEVVFYIGATGVAEILRCSEGSSCLD